MTPGRIVLYIVIAVLWVPLAWDFLLLLFAGPFLPTEAWSDPRMAKAAGRALGPGIVLMVALVWWWRKRSTKEPTALPKPEPDCPMCQSRSRCPVHS